jgi:two-component system phosphate regulon response regulator PhoB
VRVLLVDLEPESGPEAGPSAETILRDLGCDVDRRGFFPPIEAAMLPVARPDVLVLDSGPRPELGASELRRLREMPLFADAPALLAVPAAQVMRVDFSAGFADFVLTPFVPHELYVRLRQVEWHASEFSGEEQLKCEDLLVDLPGREVTVSGRRVALTRQEFDLLAFLLRHRGKVHRRERLLRSVWGVRRSIVTRTVDIHVRRLREKLGPAGRVIETVRGVGYKLA